MRGRNKFHGNRGGRDWARADAYQRAGPRGSRGKRGGDGGGRGGGGWWRYSSLWLGAIFVGLVAGVVPSWYSGFKTAARQDGQALLDGTAFEVEFGSCHVGGGTNCVVDGDTLYVEGVKIRVADIDAPETHEPKCASEKALGDRATHRLRQLVNSGEVRLRPIDRDEDRFGRKLRIVMVDGQSVGDTLVGEGLARWYEGGRRSWC